MDTTKNAESKSCSAIVVAAGKSARMNGVDKIFLRIGEKSVLEWTLSALESSTLINDITIVLNKSNLKKGTRLARSCGWKKINRICEGGKRRSDSVYEGLNLVKDSNFILIHDGARPCITPKLIQEGMQNAISYGSAVPGIRVFDTIKRVSENMEVIDTLCKKELWVIQTPQVFKRDIIIEAYKKNRGKFTDDSTLVELLGYTVKVYDGSHENIKITVPHDVETAKRILLRT